MLQRHLVVQRLPRRHGIASCVPKKCMVNWKKSNAICRTIGTTCLSHVDVVFNYVYVIFGTCTSNAMVVPKQLMLLFQLFIMLRWSGPKFRRCTRLWLLVQLGMVPTIWKPLSQNHPKSTSILGSPSWNPWFSMLFAACRVFVRGAATSWDQLVGDIPRERWSVHLRMVP